MDVLEGVDLVRKDGSTVSFDDIKANNQFIGIYFSAHWCPPCRQFTPVLAEVYKDLRGADKMFEVVFVSDDKTEEEMLAYMNECHGDWTALPKSNTTVKTALDEKFKVDSIPRLVILRTYDGNLVAEDARYEMDAELAEVWERWIK